MPKVRTALGKAPQTTMPKHMPNRSSAAAARGGSTPAGCEQASECEPAPLSTQPPQEAPSASAGLPPSAARAAREGPDKAGPPAEVQAAAEGLQAFPSTCMERSQQEPALPTRTRAEKEVPGPSLLPRGEQEVSSPVMAAAVGAASPTALRKSNRKCQPKFIADLEDEMQSLNAGRVAKARSHVCVCMARSRVFVCVCNVIQDGTPGRILYVCLHEYKRATESNVSEGRHSTEQCGKANGSFETSNCCNQYTSMHSPLTAATSILRLPVATVSLQLR